MVLILTVLIIKAVTLARECFLAVAIRPSLSSCIAGVQRVKTVTAQQIIFWNLRRF
jgi:hypothetical protein